VTHLHDAYIVALPHVSIILYEGDNSIGLCSSTFAGSLLVHKDLDTQVRHLSLQVSMNPGTGGYKTRDHMIAYLVILEDVRVVSRDALLLGKGLDVLLLRNHNSHQETLQQQQ